jgi:hypothetical protein
MIILIMRGLSMVTLINCVHPLSVKLSLTHRINHDVQYIERFIGIQANASTLSPEELDQGAGILFNNSLHRAR